MDSATQYASTLASGANSSTLTGIGGVASGLTSAIGTIKQGNAAAEAAQAQSTALMQQSNETMQSALDQAKIIRRQGASAQSDARAAAAASGVNVNTGSAQLDATHVGNQAESDALAAIATGSRQATALQTQSQQVLAAGQARQSAARTSALAGALSSFSKWKTAKNPMSTSSYDPSFDNPADYG
jgi:hypothetical protein